MIIDIHTHTFPDRIAHNVVEKLSKQGHSKPFSDATRSGLIASMKKAGIDFCADLPVMTSTEQVFKVNSRVIEEKDSAFSEGLILFGGMHPDYPDIKGELKRLKEHGVKGIKLHPAYQKAALSDVRMLRILYEASALDLITLVHTGLDISIYDRNYASVKDILIAIDKIAPRKLILAHMGGWRAWSEAERELAGANVWMDTAFSLGRITGLPGEEELLYAHENMKAEDFVRLCRKHGTDRILFGSDSPWEDQRAYLERIREAGFTKEELDAVCGQNAVRLLQIDSREE